MLADLTKPAHEKIPARLTVRANGEKQGGVNPLDPTPPAHAELVLVRHGESTGNERGVFSGWRDLALTERGRAQATAAGRNLRARGLRFSHVFTSALRRAIDTCDLLLAACGQEALPRVRLWRLNERHCGAMHGLDKQQCQARWGEELARTYRRSWTVAPPPATVGSLDDPRADPRYQEVPDPLPLSESMGDLSARVLVAWQQHLRPLLTNGARVLVVGHGMALRALARPVELFELPELPPWKLAAPRWYRLDSSLRVASFTSIDTGSEIPDE